MATAVHKLRRLRLKRISFVDSPANQHASVVLLKRADDTPPPEEVEETPVVASVTEKPMKKDGAEPDADDMDKGMTCAKCDAPMGKGAKFCADCGAKAPESATKGAVMDLDKITDPEIRKQVEKLQADLAEALKPKAEPEPKVDVLKGLSPEARAHVEKLEKQAQDSAAIAKAASDAIEKMNEENVEKAFVEEARGFKNIAGDPKVLGPVLKRLSQNKSTEADMTELRRILKAANAAAKPLFTVVGSGGQGGASDGSAQAQITAKANELIKKGDGKVNFADAMDEIMKAEPDLWAAYTAEVQAGTAVAVNEEE